jgi:hypothetical protein
MLLPRGEIYSASSIVQEVAFTVSIFYVHISGRVNFKNFDGMR